MQRTSTRLQQDLETRLAGLERRYPEWRSWVELLRATFRAAANEAWEDPLFPPAHDAAGGAPLLDGREVRVDAARLRTLVQQLAEITAARGGSPGYRPTRAEALELLDAAVRQDSSRIERLAQAAGADPIALETIAHLAAWPVLQACGRQLRASVPADWRRGYCPVCGAWPLLAELRGLERARRLRCGRCGADWPLAWLACAYCGEQRHERLGSLVPEGHLDARKVETCAECRGYLKALTTLQAIGPAELLVSDLETVELDLAARDRDHVRPSQLGHAIDVRIADAGR